jgi:NADPH-dependent 2,4-dienoyl-CoA reductase/sulfur reductase-like enzyme/peroxiredoxin family protein/rhodanese-related sulfurtransferase/TusA-related sulfurtransferase
MKILIVGGVAGGAGAAARLRRLDENAQIIMFEKGEYISFANCGLPYYIGGEIKEKDKLTLQTPESFRARFDVDVRVLHEVVSIDRPKKTIKVLDRKSGSTYEEAYDKLILSPGSMPIMPGFVGPDRDRIFTLRNIPDTYRIKDFIDTHQPKRAVVVGGGYIGIEMAENLHNAGIEVAIVEMMDHVIGPIDYDMAGDVQDHIQSKGVKLYLKNKVNAIHHNGPALDVVLDNETIRTDMLIMSVGVAPDTAIAKEAGLDTNPRGGIIVDDHMLTSDPDIYAVGDAIEVVDYMTGGKAFIPLAGPANKQGRIVADNICGIASSYKGTQGTAILKCFDLTVASTGMNEKAAQAAGIAYEKSFTYSGSHASYYPGAVNMSVKLIFEKNDGRILGAQIVGFDGVDKRVDVFAVAIRAKMTVADLTELELAYAPPFSSAKDPVNMAGFTAENILTGKVRVIHWHDVDGIDRSKATILDVRTRYEYANGYIHGSLNIPVDSLRRHLGDIDKTKPVYVVCQIGLRGYVASRILMQNGFDVYNLSGGYRLYASLLVKKEYDFRRERREEAVTTEHKVVKESVFNEETQSFTVNRVNVDATGLQCPGPIMVLSKSLKEAADNDILDISVTDPAFISDAQAFCRRTGNTFLDVTSAKGVSVVSIQKGRTDKEFDLEEPVMNIADIRSALPTDKNIIVFSGDLDKAIASFIIANAAAAMGRKVTMFFTFWGLNVLRKPKKVRVRKDLMSRMFGMMMPRGSRRLKLSNMNMMGMGAAMIRGIMKKKNISSLEELIQSSMENGVNLVACTMSMDVMGIHLEELIDGVQIGGAAAMIANAEDSDMSLFI